MEGEIILTISRPTAKLPQDFRFCHSVLNVFNPMASHAVSRMFGRDWVATDRRVGDKQDLILLSNLMHSHILVANQLQFPSPWPPQNSKLNPPRSGETIPPPIE